MKKNKLKILNVLIFWILLSVAAYLLGNSPRSSLALFALVWAIAFGLGIIAKK
jgi:hypothetical protein